MATLITIPMLCSKVEREGRKELVSFRHPVPVQSGISAKFRTQIPVNGDVQVVINDASLQGQFAEGTTYPILLTS